MLENKNVFTITDAYSSRKFINTTEYEVKFYDGFSHRIAVFSLSDDINTKEGIVKELNNRIKTFIKSEKESREKINRMDILRKSVLGEHSL